MAWDADFYTAVISDATFSATITALAYEYKPDATLPFATYQLVSAVGEDDLSGAGEEGVRRVQLTVWADNPTQAKTLCEAGIDGAKSQLDVLSVTQRSIGRDEKQEIFGYAADMMVWWQTP